MEVYVVRHPPVHNPNNICYGQSSIELITPIDEHIRFIQKKLPQNIDIIFSSPSDRCVIIAQQLPYNISFDKRLLEINFGNWEQRKWLDIPISEIDIWNNDIVYSKPYHGENLFELSQRVKDFLKDLTHQKYDKVLIITHAGVIRCIWSFLLDIPLRNIMKLPITYNDVLHFNLDYNNSHTYLIRKG